MKVLSLCCTAFSSAFVFRRGFLSRSFVSVRKPLYLNRIMVNENEIALQSDGQSYCHLSPEDSRSVHIRQILKLNPGDNVRVGIVNKGLVDKATLISDSQNVESNSTIKIGSFTDLVTTSPPVVDLILATPRPARLVYLLPVIACLGVSNICLVGASKVEKMYFSESLFPGTIIFHLFSGSHLFSSPDELNSYFMEGLAQSAVDYHLPQLSVFKSFHHFLKHNLEKTFDLKNAHCLIAHPSKLEGLDTGLSEVLTRLHASAIDDKGAVKNQKKSRIIIAIGPEGGWEEEEVQAFEGKGFSRVSLGRRILRTDIAVSCLVQWHLRY